MEVRRRNQREHGLVNDERLRPTVTLTREFGCEGYPVVQSLQALLEERSGLPFVVMDQALLDTMAADHHISAQLPKEIGARNRFLDDSFPASRRAGRATRTITVCCAARLSPWHRREP